MDGGVLVLMSEWEECMVVTQERVLIWVKNSVVQGDRATQREIPGSDSSHPNAQNMSAHLPVLRLSFWFA